MGYKTVARHYQQVHMKPVRTTVQQHYEVPEYYHPKVHYVQRTVAQRVPQTVEVPHTTYTTEKVPEVHYVRQVTDVNEKVAHTTYTPKTTYGVQYHQQRVATYPAPHYTHPHYTQQPIQGQQQQPLQ